MNANPYNPADVFGRGFRARKRRKRRRRFPAVLSPFRFFGFRRPAMPLWIRDMRTGARLRVGRRYPLEYGGTAEILRVRLPGFFRPARVLLRYEGTGMAATHRWLTGVLSGDSIWINFPAVDLGAITRSVQRGLR